MKKTRTLSDDLPKKVCDALNLTERLHDDSDINADVLLTHYNATQPKNRIAIVHDAGIYYGNDFDTVHGNSHKYGAHPTFYKGVLDAIAVRLGFISPMSEEGKQS